MMIVSNSLVDDHRSLSFFQFRTIFFFPGGFSFYLLQFQVLIDMHEYTSAFLKRYLVQIQLKSVLSEQRNLSNTSGKNIKLQVSFIVKINLQANYKIVLPTNCLLSSLIWYDKVMRFHFQLVYIVKNISVSRNSYATGEFDFCMGFFLSYI